MYNRNVITIEPRDSQGQTKTADAALIWLHGLGASGEDFVPMVEQFNNTDSAYIRCLFPNAPIQAVSINNGCEMPSWYDIYGFSREDRVDVEGLQKSTKYVHSLIDQQINNGIASNRIVLAGFSQGGAVAYDAALSYAKPLAGLISTSSYFATVLSVTPHQANKNLMTQIYHGTLDPVVPEEMGHLAFQTLRAMGYPASYKTYPVEHNLCAEQIIHIAQWVNACLDPN